MLLLKRCLAFLLLAWSFYFSSIIVNRCWQGMQAEIALQVDRFDSHVEMGFFFLVADLDFWLQMLMDGLGLFAALNCVLFALGLLYGLFTTWHKDQVAIALMAIPLTPILLGVIGMLAWYGVDTAVFVVYGVLSIPLAAWVAWAFLSDGKDGPNSSES